MTDPTADPAPPTLIHRAVAITRARRLWSTRYDTAPQPQVRAAAHTLITEIDALTADLHRLREKTITEIRASDDANAARVDRLLGHDKPGATP